MSLLLFFKKSFFVCLFLRSFSHSICFKFYCYCYYCCWFYYILSILCAVSIVCLKKKLKQNAVAVELMSVFVRTARLFFQKGSLSVCFSVHIYACMYACNDVCIYLQNICFNHICCGLILKLFFFFINLIYNVFFIVKSCVSKKKKKIKKPLHLIFSYGRSSCLSVYHSLSG